MDGSWRTVRGRDVPKFGKKEGEVAYGVEDKQRHLLLSMVVYGKPNEDVVWAAGDGWLKLKREGRKTQRESRKMRV